MTDNEARDLVLRRLYDLRHSVPQASPKNFDDLQLGGVVLGNIMEQLAQLNLIEWKPLRSGRADGIVMFMARINAFGINAIENAASAKAAQPPAGSQNVIDFSASQKQNLDTLKEHLARLEKGEVWGSDHPGPSTADEKAKVIDDIKARIRSLEEETATSVNVPLQGVAAKAEAGSLTPSVSIPLRGVAAGARVTGAGTLTIDATVVHDPLAMHAEILKRISALEETIAKLSIAGIGHNNPPEQIEPAPPLSESEFSEITIYITLLKEQPAAPTALPTQLGVAANRLKSLSEKVYDHLEAHAIEYTISAATTATATVALWHKFADDLMALGTSMTEWLMVLMHFH
jgi:hypothetical protein